MKPSKPTAVRSPLRRRRLYPWLAALAVWAPSCGEGGRALDLEGRPVDPLAAPQAVVLLFTGVDCPISNRYAPEVGRIHAQFAPRGVAFWRVYADPSTTAEEIREHTADFSYPMPALRDPEHALVERAGAEVTPEAAVFAPGGELVYCGRIDDWYAAYGKPRAAPTRRELREVLEAVVAGRPVAVESTRAVGCFIPKPARAARSPERDS